MGLLINQLKMQVSVLSLPVLSVAFLVLLQAHQHSATVDLAILAGAAVPAIPAIGGGAVVGAAVLPAATTTALAGIAILGKIGLVLKGVLIGRALSARTTTMRPRHRGRRSVEGDDMEADRETDMAFKLLTEMEPEHCYKRIICAASAGKFYNQKLEAIRSLVNEKGAELRAGKFVSAAQYGGQHGDVAKCEQRYQCSLDLETIKLYF